MKQIITTLLLCLVCIFLSNCEKSTNPYPDFPEGRWGTSTAKLNGNEWKATCKSYIDVENPGHWSLGFAVHENNYYFLEGLDFYNVTAQTDSSNVTKVISFKEKEGVRGYYSLFDVDITLGDYHILNDAKPNYFTVDSYDSVSREIKGRFEVTFLVNRAPDANAPDTVRFTEGKFHARLDE